jgi:4-amino-4-deoxy-L-arabinose transferase-like glycosyltransferase
LIYVKLAIANLGFESFAIYAPDTNLYLLIADHILSWHEMGSYGLLRVGPGYGLILASIKLIFGTNLIWPILFSVLMGGLAPIFVYLLAHKLFESKTTALIAGVISAVSLTSISASAHILTDQTFFTFHAASLVCFVHAYKTGKIKWFVIAGIVAGIAAYVRPIGMLWPFVFIFWALVIPLGQYFRDRVTLVKQAGLAGLVMLLMIWGWSARNYVIHDEFVYCTNGMLTVRSCLIAQTAQDTWGEGKSIGDYRDIWEAEDGDRTPEFTKAYDRAEARVLNEIRNQPGVVLDKYMYNLLDNMVAPNYYAERQISQISGLVRILNSAINKWLGILLIILTAVGLLMMYRRGLVFQFWILGSTYCAFSIFLGASFWQGSRLHYPAEMAWSIVLAYLLVQTFGKQSGREKLKNPLVPEV